MLNAVLIGGPPEFALTPLPLEKGLLERHPVSRNVEGAQENVVHRVMKGVTT